MQKYISNIIPRIRKYTQKLNDLTSIEDRKWVSINNLEEKTVYIFRQKNIDLLISQNGIVRKCKWDYIDENTILVEREDGTFLFKNGFLDENILALTLDGSHEYVLFVNEDKFDTGIKKVSEIEDYLNSSYLSNQKQINTISSRSNKIDHSLNSNYQPVQSEKFNPENYPNVLTQIDEIVNFIPTDKRKIFCEIFIEKLKNLDIARYKKGNKDLVDILERVQIGYDKVSSLYNDKFFDSKFIGGLEKYIISKMN